ncbi:MAG: hypothetical protein A4S09_06075 [Proteobacteria bacterium SG_bin7]|nr:MAG: hypothetical protein A4S09_06075 [Proteobacteria bacterium SG_bin7]
MDLEIHNKPEPLKIDFTSKDRPRSANRFLYEAEVEVIKREIGDLETIRKSLGFSQRKICQLLMVDPSAWTRWMKGDKVPPHIFRALSWYLKVIEKNPIDHKPNYEMLRVQMEMIIEDLEKSRAQIRLLRIRLIRVAAGTVIFAVFIALMFLFR